MLNIASQWQDPDILMFRQRAYYEKIGHMLKPFAPKFRSDLSVRLTFALVHFDHTNCFLGNSAKMSARSAAVFFVYPFIMGVNFSRLLRVANLYR